MINFLTKQNIVPANGQTPLEASSVGKAIGKLKRAYFKIKVESAFKFVFATACIFGLIWLDKVLLAGTMGEALFNQFGETGAAAFIPLAIVMVGAFAHRLISNQSDDELKKSWMGRMTKRLSVLLLLSVAVLFSVNMLQNLYPAVQISTTVADGWSAPTEPIAQNYFKTKAAELAGIVAPFAETIFAAVSGGVLIINAFLLLILMQWWYDALRAILVGRAEYKAQMAAYNELKVERKQYSDTAATLNREAAKTQDDIDMDFALFLASQGLKELSAQRKTLPDRKLKSRTKKPEWSEIGETSLNEDPAELLKHRKEFERGISITAIFNIIQRTQS